MISTIVVCVNIALNAVLIYGYFGFPRMEIAGAAHVSYTHLLFGLNPYMQFRNLGS